MIRRYQPLVARHNKTTIEELKAEVERLNAALSFEKNIVSSLRTMVLQHSERTAELCKFRGTLTRLPNQPGILACQMSIDLNSLHNSYMHIDEIIEDLLRHAFHKLRLEIKYRNCATVNGTGEFKF